MGMLEPNRVDPSSWWQLDDSTEMIICGECLNELTGDERMTLDMVHELRDADTEPYQCDKCNTQNDAYDEEFGEDLTYGE